MKTKTEKAAGWLAKVKIGIAVGKVVVTGKPAKTLERIEGAFPIADKAFEIAELVQQLLKKK